MQKYRSIQRRRALFHLIDWLVIVFFLIVWVVARKPVPTEKPISHVKAPGHNVRVVARKPVPTEKPISYVEESGHILVQLAEPSKHTKAGIRPDPQWTLYGDGTLIFKADPSDAFWRAELTHGDIQHILNVIINQDTFFGYTQQRYGNITPTSDDDSMFLTVNANGQQKEVMLVDELPSQVASDVQANHLFAIEQFLLAYHPVSAVFYAANPDSDHDSDDGQ